MKSAIHTTITLILSLVIAQHQTFANHKQAPSRNLFPVFYNSLKFSLMSYMIAIHFWLWSYCFLQYFLPSKIKSLCKLNQSFSNKTQEDSHNDDAHLCSFICRCTSLAISPVTLQWLRLRMGTVQGGVHPVCGRCQRSDLKYSSFWPGLTQQWGTAPRLTAVRVNEDTSLDKSYGEQHGATSDRAKCSAYTVEIHLIVGFLWSQYAVALVCGLHQRKVSSYRMRTNYYYC